MLATKKLSLTGVWSRPFRCVCVRVCVSACVVHVCARACVRMCVRVYICACMCMCVFNVGCYTWLLTIRFIFLCTDHTNIIPRAY